MKLNSLRQPWQVRKEESKRLNIAPNSRFLWMHHPKNWELVTFKEEGEKRAKMLHLLLPVFTSLIAVDGINEVRSNGKSADDSVARARFMNQGLTILDPLKHDYLVTYPARGGTYYTDRFEVLELVGDVVVKSYDKDAFNEYRRELMRQQVIDLPHSHFVRLMMIDNRRSIDKYIKDQHIPEHAVKLTRHQNIDRYLKMAIGNVQKKGYGAYE